jgi:hypothetical protein
MWSTLGISISHSQIVLQIVYLMFGKRDYDYEDSFSNLSSIHDVRRRKLWTWSAHFCVWTISTAVTIVPGTFLFLFFPFVFYL